MTPAQLRTVLAALSLSQQGAARLFGQNPRTVRRWISGEQDVPAAVALALLLMERHGITVEEARAMLEEAATRPAERPSVYPLAAGMVRK